MAFQVNGFIATISALRNSIADIVYRNAFAVISAFELIVKTMRGCGRHPTQKIANMNESLCGIPFVTDGFEVGLSTDEDGTSDGSGPMDPFGPMLRLVDIMDLVGGGAVISG